MNAVDHRLQAAGSKLLQVNGLSKSFGGVKALDTVSFDLAGGELLALIGPNGAGKSTCFNCINGQLRPDAGTVRLAGRDMTGRLPREIWRLGVGRTFQIAATWSSMTVAENVQLAVLSHQGRLRQWWGRAADMARQPALELLDSVGLADLADTPCATLAYGDIKRVELAMALSNSASPAADG
jgi:branched-chain amino acid transport system ATP-binding protein